MFISPGKADSAVTLQELPYTALVKNTSTRRCFQLFFMATTVQLDKMVIRMCIPRRCVTCSEQMALFIYLLTGLST